MSSRPQLWIYAGLLLLLLGIQVRMVETYTLTPESTRVLSNWFGQPSPAPTGALERWAVNGNMVRKQYQPPAWLGYALLTSGAVMTVHGVLLGRAKA